MFSGNIYALVSNVVVGHACDVNFTLFLLPYNRKPSNITVFDTSSTKCKLFHVIATISTFVHFLTLPTRDPCSILDSECIQPDNVYVHYSCHVHVVLMVTKQPMFSCDILWFLNAIAQETIFVSFVSD